MGSIHFVTTEFNPSIHGNLNLNESAIGTEH